VQGKKKAKAETKAKVKAMPKMTFGKGVGGVRRSRTTEKSLLAGKVSPLVELYGGKLYLCVPCYRGLDLLKYGLIRLR
jgi:hypothetical protein